MKKLKDSLPQQADQLLSQHALETESLASQVRLGLAVMLTLVFIPVVQPLVPPEGVDRKDYMRAKFGDQPRVKGMSDAIRTYGAELGIAFDFEKQTRRPNTIDSHRVIKWATSVGLQDAIVEAMFKAYFEDGLDIGDAKVLTEIAARCAGRHAARRCHPPRATPAPTHGADAGVRPERFRRFPRRPHAPSPPTHQTTAA